MDLLRIAARISAIRQNKVDGQEEGKFSLDEFKKLQDDEEILDYANERLEHMGRGSSRQVYILSSQKVLKIAYDG